MKALFGAVGGFFDMVPGWVWAAIAAALVLNSCHQGLKIDQGKLALSQQETKTQKANGETETAKKELSNRIAAEAVVVADAVEKARKDDLAKAKLQQEKIYALHEQNATAELDLASAHDRVRSTIDAAAAGASCGRVPGDPAAAGGTENGAVDKFKAAGRKLADGILQLLADGDKVARERNLCAELNYGPKK